MATIIQSFNSAGSATKPTTSNAPPAHVVALTDGEGNILAGGAGSVGAPGVTRIEDGTSTNLATISAFHNADNQALAGTAFGLLTGGVAQLLNPTGNLDRQRETGADVIPNMGISTGTQQLAWPVTLGPVTSGAITGSPNPQTVTLTAVTGTTRGVVWALGVGQAVVLDANTATQEAFTITAMNVGAKTVTGVIRNNHTITAPVVGFFYDQARSGMILDGSSGQGMAAGATYLLNSTLNTGAGGWEGERSAAGELDGASGVGTAVAAEYEHNTAGPVLASGLASGLGFDRARNLQGKGTQTQAITTTTAGNTSVVFGSATATNLVQPGSPLVLSGGAVQETYYVTTTWTPGSSATVPLLNAVVNAGQTTVRFDVYSPQGPQLNGFTAVGLGIEEEALYDPVTGLYFIERAATQDAMPPQNIVAECGVLWNGTTMDRMRGAQGVEFSTVGGSATVPVPGGTVANTVIKGTAGRLCRVLITATGTNPVQIFDNATTASGTIIGAFAASPPVGTVADFQFPAANGITVGGNAANPAMTISFY